MQVIDIISKLCCIKENTLDATSDEIFFCRTQGFPTVTITTRTFCTLSWTCSQQDPRPHQSRWDGGSCSWPSTQRYKVGAFSLAVSSRPRCFWVSTCCSSGPGGAESGGGQSSGAAGGPEGSAPHQCCGAWNTETGQHLPHFTASQDLSGRDLPGSLYSKGQCMPLKQN